MTFAIRLLLFGVTASGCVLSDEHEPRRSDTARSAAREVTQYEAVVGHWDGDHGAVEFRPTPDGVIACCIKEEGTFAGTWDVDGVLRGWWTETPSRRPDKDAGGADFRLVEDADGLLLDGRWRYGTTGDWHDDWDLRPVDGPSPAGLSSCFDDPSLFDLGP
jgi:hypothetical protein